MVSHIPISVLKGVTEQLSLNDLSSIRNFTFAGGGCINQGGRLETSIGIFFLKWNDTKKFPGMFEAESKGLKLLHHQRAIRIPKVLAVGENGSYQFLLLEFIEQQSRSKKFWRQLGNCLASLHRNSFDTYGLDHDNYIGSLRQLNKQDSSWINFFIQQRLAVQVAQAVDSKLAGNNWIKHFDALYKKLPELLTDEKPALLHGDLWSGNLITDESGQPCLIDPAVYYGNRETDLAMTQLFGGFDETFYSSYHDDFPLLPGLEDRLEVYKLYPLLVHVNLFGTSYVPSVEGILRRFI